MKVEGSKMSVPRPSATASPFFFFCGYQYWLGCIDRRGGFRGRPEWMRVGWCMVVVLIAPLWAASRYRMESHFPIHYGLQNDGSLTHYLSIDIYYTWFITFWSSTFYIYSLLPNPCLAYSINNPLASPFILSLRRPKPGPKQFPAHSHILFPDLSIQAGPTISGHMPRPPSRLPRNIRPGQEYFEIRAGTKNLK